MMRDFLKPNTRGAEQRLLELLHKHVPKRKWRYDKEGSYVMSAEDASLLHELLTSESREDEVDWGVLMPL